MDTVLSFFLAQCARLFWSLVILLVSGMHVASAQTPVAYQVKAIGPHAAFAGQDIYIEIQAAFSSQDTLHLYFDRIVVPIGATASLACSYISNSCFTNSAGRTYQWGGKMPVVLKVSLPLTLLPDSYLIEITTSLSGTVKTTAVPVLVRSRPERPVRQLTPQPPLLPGLETWEFNMKHLGTKWCQAESTMSFGVDSQVWFYDGARVYFQIADYTNDKSWEKCALNIARQYRDYVIRVNGALPGWGVFPHGLLMAYERTHDESFKTALRLLVKKSAYAGSGGKVSDQFIRETAYALQGYLMAEKLGEPRNPLASRSVDFLLSNFSQLFEGGNYSLHQTFYDGLAAAALIEWYEATGDPRIPVAIRQMLDWVWNRGWSGSALIYNPDPIGPRCANACQKYATDLINLVAPAFAWYWSITGDAEYLRRGDELFFHATDTDVSYSGKIFSQNYRWSFNYLVWRGYITRNDKTLLLTPPQKNGIGDTEQAGGGEDRPVLMRINSGAVSAKTDEFGNKWLPDSYFSGGSTSATTFSIIGTQAAKPYQDYRLGQFSYNIPVPNGRRKVLLRFIEPFYKVAGVRRFSVEINGKFVLTAFDPLVSAGASLTVVDRQFEIDVVNGWIQINFIPTGAGGSICAGIEIR